MTIRIVAIGLSFFAALLVSAADYDHVQRSEIEEAFAQMMTIQDDPFVILEVAATGQFIQAANFGSGPFLDLPTDGLSQEEMQRALKYFPSHGISPLEQRAAHPETQEIYTHIVFTHTFDSSELDRMVQIIIGALYEIYGIADDTPLTIQTGLAAFQQ